MRRNKVHRHGEKETHDAETNHRLQALRGSRAFHLPKVYHFIFVLLSFFLSSLLLVVSSIRFYSVLLEQYSICSLLRERERERGKRTE